MIWHKNEGHRAPNLQMEEYYRAKIYMEIFQNIGG